MTREPAHSLLDAVDNALGLVVTARDIMQLGKSRTNELAELLAAFYDRWSPPTAVEHSVRVFVDPGDIRYIDWEPDTPVPRPPLHALLYVDSLAMPDPASGPVMALLGRGGHAPWTLVRRVLACSIESFRPCEPLFRDGSLMLLPESHLHAVRNSTGLQLQEAIWEQLPVYEPLWWQETALAEEEVARIVAERFPSAQRVGYPRAVDITWGDDGVRPLVAIGSESIVTSRGVVTGSQRTLGFYGRLASVTRDVLSGVSHSLYAQAQLLPSSVYAEATYNALLPCLQACSAPPGSELPRFLPALAAGVVPLLNMVPVSTLVTIRQDESAFAAWRAQLRNAMRLVRLQPNDPGFAVSAREILQDTLMPTLAELRRSASVIGRIRAGTPDATIGFAVGALTVAISGHFEISTTLPVAGASASAGLALRALFPRGESGSRAVVLRLRPYLAA